MKNPNMYLNLSFATFVQRLAIILIFVTVLVIIITVVMMSIIGGRLAKFCRRRIEKFVKGHRITRFGRWRLPAQNYTTGTLHECLEISHHLGQAIWSSYKWKFNRICKNFKLIYKLQYVIKHTNEFSLKILD